MVEPTCELCLFWKQVGKAVKVLRCDNGVENIALKQRMNKCRLEIKNWVSIYCKGNTTAE